MAQSAYNYLTGKQPKKTLFDAASYTGIPKEISSQGDRKTAGQLLEEAEAYVKEQTKGVVAPERDLSYDQHEGGLLTEKLVGAGSKVADVVAENVPKDIKNSFEAGLEALKGADITGLVTDVSKGFVKDGGEGAVPALKKGMEAVGNFLGENAPVKAVEGAGTVLARPAPKLTAEEQKQVADDVAVEMKETGQLATVLDNADPNTKEGKNAWQRTADYLDVPFDWLLDSWKKLDEASGGYASGVAGVLGSAGGAVAEGASYLNDKIDFLAMLSVGAQAAARTNNAGIAVLQGLAGGVQARQQQKAAAAKQRRDDARWNAEQNVREYNALTTRGRAVADAQKQGKKDNLLELSTSDNRIVTTVAEGAGVSEEVAQTAVLNLKAAGKPYTPQQVRNEIERMKATGEVSSRLFGTDKLM
ncbi:hypothetical protein CPT_Phriendly_046 [Vibrio phage Phriendly]|nr:hypothetical protein CPT_Phriendly_046 [Vibrio phage Phriendly]